MLKRMVPVLLLLLAPAALGEPYTSTEYGFVADFPSAPTVGQPEGSEKDKQGNFISTSVTFMSIEPGSYVALVTAESYVVPISLNIPASMAVQRDSLVKAMNATATSSRPATLDGHPALYFSYDTPDHSMAGDGVVTYIETAKPKCYIAATTHAPNATAAQLADLARFISSFHVQ